MASSTIGAKPYTYVALHDQSAVAVYDHGSSAWLGSIAVGTAPVGVTASPSQQRVYVSNHAANTVSVIRTADRAVIATVSVGSRPMMLIALSIYMAASFFCAGPRNTLSQM